MAIKLAQFIMDGKTSYKTAVKMYGKYKDDIDFILKAEGFEHLIVES